MSEKPTALDAVKIQARAVIPIVRALEREIGRERTHFIVGRAIAESHAEWQAKAASTRDSHPRNTDIEEQFPIETEVVEDTDSTYAVNMMNAGSQNTSARSERPTSGRCSPAVSTSRQSQRSAPIGSFSALKPSWGARATATSDGGCAVSRTSGAGRLTKGES